MPVRFTTPSLGGQGELQVADLAAHQWRLAVGYRHLHADQLFVGTDLVPTNKPRAAALMAKVKIPVVREHITRRLAAAKSN